MGETRAYISGGEGTGSMNEGGIFLSGGTHKESVGSTTYTANLDNRLDYPIKEFY